MKKLLPVVILSFLITVRAQENKEAIRNLNGSKAILFNINNLSLNSFDGGFGFKYWSSELTALVSKINFTFNENTKDKTATLTGSKSKELSYGLSIGIEKHFAFQSGLSPYSALTAGIGYENSTANIISPNPFQQYYDNELNTSLLSLSIAVSFGIEYLLTESISISGQYDLNFLYNKGDETYTSHYSRTKVGVSEFRTGVASGMLILGVYF